VSKETDWEAETLCSIVEFIRSICCDRIELGMKEKQDQVELSLSETTFLPFLPPIKIE